MQHQDLPPKLLDHLPAEILLFIFSFFDAKTLSGLASVSHYFKTMSRDDSLWKEKMIKHDFELDRSRGMPDGFQKFVTLYKELISPEKQYFLVREGNLSSIQKQASSFNDESIKEGLKIARQLNYTYILDWAYQWWGKVKEVQYEKSRIEERQYYEGWWWKDRDSRRQNNLLKKHQVTKLHIAIECLRSLEDLTGLLKDVTYSHEIICQAVEAGHLTFVKSLIESQLSTIHAQHPLTRARLLFIAAVSGHAHILRYLLENGAELEPANQAKPLSGAVQEGHLHCVKLLAEYGTSNLPVAFANDLIAQRLQSILIDITKKPTFSFRDMQVLKYVIDRCANYLNEDEKQAFLKWVCESKYISIMKYLLTLPAFKKDIIEDTHNIFHLAISGRYFLLIAWLLSQNRCLLEKRVNGRTPLAWAIEIRSIRMVNYFIGQGAAINAMGEFLILLLKLIIKHDDTELFKLLLNKGLTIPAVFQFNILEWVCENGHEKLLQILFESDHFKDEIRQTAYRLFFIAIEAQHLAIIQLLLGYDKTLLERRNPESLTPLHLAVSSKAVPIARYLIEQGADVNAGSDFGPVGIFSLRYNHLEMFNLFREKKAEMPYLLHESIFYKSGDITIAMIEEQPGLLKQKKDPVGTVLAFAICSCDSRVLQFLCNNPHLITEDLRNYPRQYANIFSQLFHLLMMGNQVELMQELVELNNNEFHKWLMGIESDDFTALEHAMLCKHDEILHFLFFQKDNVLRNFFKRLSEEKARAICAKLSMPHHQMNHNIAVFTTATVLHLAAVLERFPLVIKVLKSLAETFKFIEQGVLEKLSALAESKQWEKVKALLAFVFYVYDEELKNKISIKGGLFTPTTLDAARLKFIKAVQAHLIEGPASVDFSTYHMEFFMGAKRFGHIHCDLMESGLLSSFDKRDSREGMRFS